MNFGTMILSIGISLIVYVVLAKTFKIKSRNIVYGNIALNCLIAIVTGLFFIGISPMFVISSLLMVAAMLVMVLLEEK